MPDERAIAATKHYGIKTVGGDWQWTAMKVMNGIMVLCLVVQIAALVYAALR